jgi:methylated-DNA-protein-cysteine methyltransferase-like protein
VAGAAAVGGKLHGVKRRSTYERLTAIARRIPRGRVATYGQIATLAGLRGHARQAGYAMAALPAGTLVPWHRVINARGMISARRHDTGGSISQRILLEREGVRFDARGVVSLDQFQWRPRPSGR